MVVDDPKGRNETPGTSGGGVPLSSISMKNSDSMNALCSFFGIDRQQLDLLIEEAWAREAGNDPQLMDRALSTGVELAVAHGDGSASLRVARNKKKVEGRPLYVMWPQRQAAQTRPGGAEITRGALERLARLMPGMSSQEIRSLVEGAIEEAERSGKVDTRWRPRESRAGEQCCSLWLSASREGDRDIRIAYSREAGGARTVFYAERQRAMKSLESFAYMGRWADVLESLAGMAEPEPWDDGDGSRSILKSYLKATFARAERQGKIRLSEDGHAAFNTGLKTARGYEIVALFGPNDRTDARQQYRFAEFVTPQGRGSARAHLPIVSSSERATYVERSSDLIMGWPAALPTLSEDHILIDRVDRLPMEFLRSVDQMDDAWRALLDAIERDGAGEQEREEAYEGLRGILRENDGLYGNLLTLIRAEAEKAFDELRVYPYNSLPVYNPERDDLAFVLPIRLMSKAGQPNAALLVEEVSDGVFRAHTVLTMEMAYADARVISPPKNSWLAEQFSPAALEIRALRKEVEELRAQACEHPAADSPGAEAPADVVETGGDASDTAENERLRSTIEELESRVESLTSEAEAWKGRALEAEELVRQAKEQVVQCLPPAADPEEGNPEFPADPVDEPAEKGGEGTSTGSSMECGWECDKQLAVAHDKILQATLYRGGELVITDDVEDGLWCREYGLAIGGRQWYFRSTDDFSECDSAPWSVYQQDILSVTVIGANNEPRKDDTAKGSWSMTRWFAELPNLKTASFENVDLSSCSSLKQLFFKCPSLEAVTFKDSPLRPNTSVAGMFVGCPRHIEITIAGTTYGDMEGRLLAELARRSPYGTKRAGRADLDGLTWGQIARISSLISAGDAAQKYGLCGRDGKAYPLEKRLSTNGGTADVVLVDLPSQERGGMFFMFCSPVASRKMTNGGLFAKANWGESDARAWLNGEFFSALPRDLADVVAVTDIESYAGGIVRTKDRVFLPSIAYYPDAEEAPSPAGGGGDGVEELVWLRDSPSPRRFCALSRNGKVCVHEPMTNKHGIQPCFCV